MHGLRYAAATVALLGFAGHSHAVPIVNPSFENDPNNAAEFFFGNPEGWTLYDPGTIVGGGSETDVQGTLAVTGSAYFGGVAPDGDNVAILFIGEDMGTSEFGIRQALTGNTLQAHTLYSLTVDVGNIESGPTQQFGDFNLDGFPGYRAQLLAGSTVVAEVMDGIDAAIGEGLFAPMTLEFATGAAHANLGDTLGIRLVNRNLTDPSFPDADVEVDFDNVRLEASALRTAGVPTPTTGALLAAGLLPLAWSRRRRG